jgi:DNA-binding CsgD family transcriptional regulator
VARTAADATDAVAACRPADEVVELCQRALADGVLADSPPHGVSTALTLSMMLGYAGRPDLGGDQIAHVVARLHARRVRLFLRPAVAMRGALALMAGRLLDAERDLRAAFDEDAPRELAPWRMQSAPLMTGFLVVCQLARGDLDGAAATVEESDLDIVLQDILPNAFFLFARAELRRARGDLHGALGDLRMCGRRLQAGNWENPAIAPWRGTAARVLMELGDVEQARALTAAELRFARAAGVPSVLARALRDRAAVLEPAAARGLLEESVALASASPLEHAESLTDLGALVLDGGALEGARDLLRDGLTVARATGAEPLARRAAALLHTAGGRPRRTNGIGLDVLTAAERRVAVLAGEGRTNREIAEQLVVSLKTVETHLRSAYRKLGIGSRAQLPEAIADAS